MSRFALIGIVLLACSVKIIADLVGWKMPEDDGIVWNTAIEKRMTLCGKDLNGMHRVEIKDTTSTCHTSECNR